MHETGQPHNHLPAANPRTEVPESTGDPNKLRRQAELKARMERGERSIAAEAYMTLVTNETPTFHVQVQELRDVCDLHPNHPTSAIFRAGVAGKDPNRYVAVEQIDLEALLTDQETEFFERIEVNPHTQLKERVRRKRLRVKGSEPSPDAVLPPNTGLPPVPEQALREGGHSGIPERAGPPPGKTTGTVVADER